MFEFFKNLSSKSTAADLRASLETLNIDALESALIAAQKERAGLLLTGTDAQVLAAEAAISKARIDLDRARAMQEEIGLRVVEAERREIEDAFRAKHDAATEMNRAFVKKLGGEVARAARVVDAALVAVEGVERAQADVAREIIRNVGEGNSIETTPFPPSLNEWLNGADDDIMPRWCRSLLFERVQRYQYR